MIAPHPDQSARTAGIDGELPAFVVAATHSGAGKTTVTAALLRGLCERGLTVQSFKIGPDFIDPAYHREITGRPSVNLDLWLMDGADTLRRTLRSWSRGADVCVVEAMGALHDGENGTGHGSAAHVARELGLPVVVVLDVWGMTRTAGAILAGLRDFDPDVRIVGCVLNRVGSPRHAGMVTDALPEELRRLVVGSIPDRDELRIAERHLGLVTVEENGADPARRAEAQREAGRGLDLDRLLELTRVAVPAAADRPGSARPPAAPVRLAVARDEAFCFYYDENLRALADAGFELVPFHPTRDERLPEGVGAVYLGGGYPESFAAELSANRPLAAELRDRAGRGMPVHAECGGMMYLARSLTGFDGTRVEMAGVLPIDITMDPKHLSIGYVEAVPDPSSPFGDTGRPVRGQEFHQSRVTAADLEPNLYAVTTNAGERYRAGYLVRNVMASYLHLYLAERQESLRNLHRSATRYTADRRR